MATEDMISEFRTKTRGLRIVFSFLHFHFTLLHIVSSTAVLFSLFVIVEPLIHLRVCHGTPINKNFLNTNYLQEGQIFLYQTLQQINSYYRS